MSQWAAALAAVLLITPAGGLAQSTTCTAASSIDALADCLTDPNPAIRDGIAFEQLSTQLRAGALDAAALRSLRDRLLPRAASGGTALQPSFPALMLSEIARTDRIKPWMTDAERDAMVSAAARFLSTITDYRAFTASDGYFHAVAHGSDWAMQLARNPATTKPQLDHLLAAIATQVVPKDPTVAYWAGEPDRMARAVIFIAQRTLHSDDEWKAWVATVMTPAPLVSWDVASNSENGICKHHNARLFLLSLFASALTTDDPGIKQLIGPVRDSLKLVP
jgi:hypothetical protein